MSINSCYMLTHSQDAVEPWLDHLLLLDAQDGQEREQFHEQLDAGRYDPEPVEAPMVWGAEPPDVPEIDSANPFTDQLES